MSRDDRLNWDQKWESDQTGRNVSRLLVANRHLLNGGVGLDIACGVGQNTIWLARRGFRALGVDVSRVALRRAVAAAGRAGVRRQTSFAQVDLDYWAPPALCVDVICVFRFLDRSLIADLRRALRPGGLIFYGTRHVGRLARYPQATADFLLQRGELQRLFSPWPVVYAGEDAENAALVARKPRQAAERRL